MCQVATKQSNKWCGSGNYVGSYTSMSSAETACAASSSCFGINDLGCNGLPSFKLCTTSSFETSTSGSCVYKYVAADQAAREAAEAERLSDNAVLLPPDNSVPGCVMQEKSKPLNGKGGPTAGVLQPWTASSAAECANKCKSGLYSANERPGKCNAFEFYSFLSENVAQLKEPSGAPVDNAYSCHLWLVGTIGAAEPSQTSVQSPGGGRYLYKDQVYFRSRRPSIRWTGTCHHTAFMELSATTRSVDLLEVNSGGPECYPKPCTVFDSTGLCVQICTGCGCVIKYAESSDGTECCKEDEMHVKADPILLPAHHQNCDSHTCTVGTLTTNWRLTGTTDSECCSKSCDARTCPAPSVRKRGDGEYYLGEFEKSCCTPTTVSMSGCTGSVDTRSWEFIAGTNQIRNKYGWCLTAEKPLQLGRDSNFRDMASSGYMRPGSKVTISACKPWKKTKKIYRSGQGAIGVERPPTEQAWTMLSCGLGPIEEGQCTKPDGLPNAAGITAKGRIQKEGLEKLTDDDSLSTAHKVQMCKEACEQHIGYTGCEATTHGCFVHTKTGESEVVVEGGGFNESNVLIDGMVIAISTTTGDSPTYCGMNDPHMRMTCSLAYPMMVPCGPTLGRGQRGSCADESFHEYATVDDDERALFRVKQMSGGVAFQNVQTGKFCRNAHNSIVCDTSPTDRRWTWKYDDKSGFHQRRTFTLEIDHFARRTTKTEASIKLVGHGEEKVHRTGVCSSGSCLHGEPGYACHAGPHGNGVMGCNQYTARYRTEVADSTTFYVTTIRNDKNPNNFNMRGVGCMTKQCI